MIRVMIVEDSPTSRAALVQLLEGDPEVQVVGQAKTGTEALRMSGSLQRDLITMDIVLPDMDGVEATERIMGCYRAPIVIVTAHTESRELNIAFRAMKAGAVDVVSKSTILGREATRESQQAFLAEIKELAAAHPRATGEA